MHDRFLEILDMLIRRNISSPQELTRVIVDALRVAVDILESDLTNQTREVEAINRGKIEAIREFIAKHEN